MRRVVVAVVGVVLGALVATLAGAGGPARADDLAPVASKYLNRLFIVTCPWSHTSSDDPIAHPGMAGMSHSHDFFGNTSTDADSTLASMQGAGTTCNRPGDTAGYWMPTVLEDGAPVTPGNATFYYRAPGPDPAAVQAFPAGFKMVAGNPGATSAQPLKYVEWACRDEGAKKPWRADIPQCADGQDLAFRVNFPDCWNGRDLDSADHRSHVAYSDKNGLCPAAFPVRLPEIAMTAIYPDLHGGQVTLSVGSNFAGHADFWNTWQPGAQEALVDSCLHAARDCGDFAGPGGAGPLVSPRPPGAAAPVTGSGASRLSGAGGPTAWAQGVSLSADGAWSAYEVHSGGSSQVVVRPTAGGPARTVSVTPAGAAGDAGSWSPSISGDGRYVAFASDADDLVAGDTNRSRDVFVRDLRTGRTVRVAGTAGQPDGSSVEPRISDDGRFVVFTSLADDLTPGDTNRQPDVFRYTVADGSVVPVSVTPDGSYADQSSTKPDISGDGRYVVFSSWAHDLAAADTNHWSDVYLRDLATGRTELVSLNAKGRAPDSSSYAPSVSDDGRYVVFESAATDLVKGDKGFRDVFVRDRSAGTTTKLSGAPYKKVSGLSTDAQISADGSTVVFQSSNARLAGNASAPLDVFSVCSDGTGLGLVSAGGDQPSGVPSISRDGAGVAFESSSSTLASPAASGDLEVYAARLAAGC